MLLRDFFTDSPFEVEIERDLSVQQQRLDILIVRRQPGDFTGTLPDGLDDLASHNLLTFRSHRQPLDAWTLLELIGHGVAYRKFVSPSLKELRPLTDFHYYAVCARYPHNLAAEVDLERLQPGVYNSQWGPLVIRVVVAGELPPSPHNAPLHLFAANAERVHFGQEHYRQRSPRTSQLLYLLWLRYRGEGITMPYTTEDFLEEFIKESFEALTPQERIEVLKTLRPQERIEALKTLTSQERIEVLKTLTLQERGEVLKTLTSQERIEVLKTLTPQERIEALKTLTPQERGEALKILTPQERGEVLKTLPPEELLQALSPEQMQAYLQHLAQATPTTPEANQPPPQSKRRRRN
jgi:hypothetical protein